MDDLNRVPGTLRSNRVNARRPSDAYQAVAVAVDEDAPAAAGRGLMQGSHRVLNLRPASVATGAIADVGSVNERSRGGASDVGAAVDGHRPAGSVQERMRAVTYTCSALTTGEVYKWRRLETFTSGDDLRRLQVETIGDVYTWRRLETFTRGDDWRRLQVETIGDVYT